MPKLTIAEVQDKVAKSGEPYKTVKSSNGKWLYCWKQYEYIWHLLVAGATLDISIATKDNFTYITGVMGVEAPNKDGGITIATNKDSQLQSGFGALLERLFIQSQRIEKKLDDLAAYQGMVERQRDKLPSLDELPVVNLEDKDDIDPTKIPF